MPFLSLVTLTFNLWPWPSNSSERGTKHVFHVNLMQIRSAIFEIFIHKQKTDWRRHKQNLPPSPRAVIIPNLNVTKCLIWNFTVYRHCHISVVSISCLLKKPCWSDNLVCGRCLVLYCVEWHVWLIVVDFFRWFNQRIDMEHILESIQL